MNYEKCLNFTIQKHKEQKRKNTLPYYIHCVLVAQILKNSGFGLEYQITALFHDLLEDTDATEEEILGLSNKEILESVKLLTKEKGYITKEYLDKISKNEIAFNVKMVDRIHNLFDLQFNNNEYQKQYIENTIKYYVPLAKGTSYENKINSMITFIEK